MHADYADSFPQTGRLELNQATSAEALSSLIHTSREIESIRRRTALSLAAIWPLSLAAALHLPKPHHERTAL